jgi:hypothetical protein
MRAGREDSLFYAAGRDGRFPDRKEPDPAFFPLEARRLR